MRSYSPRRRALLCAAPALLASLPARAQAQAQAAASYPSKAIRLILPEVAGGLPTTVARLIAEPLSRRLGQTIVVDNRPGAGGTIGARQLLQEPVDGYTLLFTNIGPQVIAPLVYRPPPYQPLDDFTPIALSIINTGGFLVVRSTLPIQTPRQLFAYAKANPGKLTFASTGMGSIMHLALELMKQQTGTDILHIPFQGPTPAMTALVSGDVDITIAGSLAAVLPFVQSGKVRLLARVGRKRAPEFPDVPTLYEDAVPDFVLPFWMGFVGRAGIPAEIVRKLNDEINAVTAADATLKAYAAQSYLEVVQGPPQLLRDAITRDLETFGRIVREKNITNAG